jgi:hypothetical protein
MRAMPFPEYVSPLSRDRLNVFYSVCQIFATSQVLFSYHLDEVFAGMHAAESSIATQQLRVCVAYLMMVSAIT